MEHHATLVRANDRESYIATLPQGAVALLHDTFGIDEARQLASDAQLRPANGEASRFVISTGFITHEAQNALLKLFEEPPADTFFTLVVPQSLQLLPTLQSRIGHELMWQSEQSGNQVWAAFTSASYPDRLKQIETWQKNKDKDPHWLPAMVAGVHSISVTKLSSQDAQVVLFVGSKLATRGASNKMLLEHLALLLPLQK